jgi:hypothetical protein
MSAGDATIHLTTYDHSREIARRTLRRFDARTGRNPAGSHVLSHDIQLE